jgi:predicted NUDIX family phosphoesterase
MKHNLGRFLTPEAEAESEWVAGVTRAKLVQKFSNLPFSGIVKIGEDELVDFLQANLEFRPRTEALERDESFKQMICYFLIRNEHGEFLFSQRKSKGGEARAHGSYLFGFGGHLRKEDIKGPMSEWLSREAREEVGIQEIVNISFAGILNNDSDELQGVNRVHFGLVFVVDVKREAQLLETDKFETGRFVAATDMLPYVEKMETWSRIIWDGLRDL